MTFAEAVKQARHYAHSSYFHQQAMSVLFQAYRAAHRGHPHIELEELWSWVDTQSDTGGPTGD